MLFVYYLRLARNRQAAHEFTSEEAREAGHKGGEAVSQDREHMAEIGREGGQNSHGGGRNEDSDDADSEEKGTQGGTREQYAEAERHHKNK